MDMFTKPQVNRKFKQPDATALVQVVKAAQGGSEISCVIDQDSRAVPMGHTAETLKRLTHLTTHGCSEIRTDANSELLK